MGVQRVTPSRISAHSAGVSGYRSGLEQTSQKSLGSVTGEWERQIPVRWAERPAAAGLVAQPARRMLLHLPRRPGHGDLPRIKNGPALAGHGAEAVRDAMARTIMTLPRQLRRSLTWDQGAEMARHPELPVRTGLSIHFCDPHNSSPRGANENTNGLLRQGFPKGIDLSLHGPDDLEAVAAALSSRPRRTLGWKTRAETLDEVLAEVQTGPVATTG